MNYPYQFLLNLYRNRKYHPDNKIWIYQYQHVEQNGHYLKIYLFCKNKGKQLEEVSFQLQHGEQIQTVSIKEFHKIKQSYQPYLKGCIIPMEDDFDDISLKIISYQIDGKTYDFMNEDIEVILTDDQKNQARNAFLLQQMDITMMPSIQDQYCICACGNIHQVDEACPNCHRSYSEIKTLVEKGQETLCKEALLKKYCQLSELEKRNHKTEQWIEDIQKEAGLLNITLSDEDYASFIKQATSAHRKDIAKTIFLSISCGLGLFFTFLLLVGFQPLNNTWNKNTLPNDSLYSSYGNNDSYQNKDTDNLYSYSDETYQYKTCTELQDDMNLSVSFSANHDVIEEVMISMEMTPEQLGSDPSLLDDTQLSVLESQVLSEYGLTGHEDGVYADVYTIDTYLVIDIDIDMQSVEDKTLKAFDLVALRYYSYQEVISQFEQSSMYCY